METVKTENIKLYVASVYIHVLVWVRESLCTNSKRFM